jgi:poly(beta-D-mannuronate) lyase
MVHSRRTVAWCAAVVAWAPVAVACPPPPAPVRDLDIPRYYSDRAGTEIDPSLRAQHAAATAPLIEFLRLVTASADRAVAPAGAQAQLTAARCALAALEAWARAGALLGRVSQQGEYQRKWDLAGAAFAYIKVRSHATAAQRQIIEPWLAQVGRAARAFFDNPGRRRNNHWYWLGLAMAGVGLATDDEKSWLQAKSIFNDAVHDIDERGALPLEMDRGSRALHYHAFSAMPLVVLAEIAAARGEDWYGAGNGAVHRLVAFTVRGFEDPVAFERLAGAAQKLTPNSAGAGWTVLYRDRFPGSAAMASMPQRTSHRLLGGDVRRLIAAVRRPAYLRRAGSPSP